jgi:ribulose 1,5-bisphosphate synthetase/thiazole synthase
MGSISTRHDVVIVGGGHNGFVAANVRLSIDLLLRGCIFVHPGIGTGAGVLG